MNANDLRFAARLSNVYEHAIRAKFANAQTSARWRLLCSHKKRVPKRDPFFV